MNQFLEYIEQAETIAVMGHVRPDGDCVGSCLGVYNYITDNYKDKTVTVYLQPFSKEFMFLKGADKVVHDSSEPAMYDLAIGLDCGDTDRLGEFYSYFKDAAKTICVDHHISNQGFGNYRVIEPKASSTCEVLFDLLNPDLLSQETAEALYLGIVHDTGVFKHSNTTKKAMTVAGSLIEKGARPNYVIDETFYKKTYVQNQLLGRALLESFLFMDDKCIVACIKRDVFEFYGASSVDCDGIVDQLRITEGVEVAIFMYEVAEQEFKVSMRSNNYVDVSKIAAYFGGGGHVRAAGVTMHGSFYDIINNISQHIESQMQAFESSEEKID